MISVPPPMNSDLRNFFRFRSTGRNAANPIGTKTPAARNSLVGVGRSREVE